jgi:hypothetical protein
MTWHCCLHYTDVFVLGNINDDSFNIFVKKKKIFPHYNTQWYSSPISHKFDIDDTA